MSKTNSNIFQIIILIFAIIAAILSGYLLIDHFELSSSTSILYKLCSATETFDCDKVNSSTYSTFSGFPVAAYGLFYYAFVAFMIVLILLLRDKQFTDQIKVLLFIISSISVLMILPLSYISIIKINALCTLCISTWICSIIIFVLMLGLIKEKDDLSFFIGFKNSMKNLISCFLDFKGHATHLILMVLTTLLVGISVFSFSEHLEMKNELRKFQMSLTELDKHLSRFYKNKVFDIKTDNIPLPLGNADAKHTIVVYSDFNCSACRKAESVMGELEKRFHGKLKAIMKNFPLDAQCNPVITKPKGKAGLSCNAALISVILRETDGYHKYVSHIMHSKDKLSENLIKSAVIASGVDEGLIAEKFQDDRIKKILQDEMKEGYVAGVTSTPALFLNGRRLGKGLPPKYIIDRLIQMEIARSN